MRPWPLPHCVPQLCHEPLRTKLPWPQMSSSSQRIPLDPRMWYIQTLHTKGLTKGGAEGVVQPGHPVRELTVYRELFGYWSHSNPVCMLGSSWIRNLRIYPPTLLFPEPQEQPMWGCKDPSLPQFWTTLEVQLTTEPLWDSQALRRDHKTM